MADKLDNLYNLLKKDTNYSNAKVLASPEAFKNSFGTEESMDKLYGLLKADTKYSSASVLSSPDIFKKSFFNIEPIPEKEPAGFFDGLISRFADLAGTEKDQTNAYLKELNKSKKGTIGAPPKSDWQAYNDLTNLLKPTNKPLDATDYTNTDNYLKSLDITTSGHADDEENPFSFNFGKPENKDQSLKVKDDIERIKNEKIKEIRDQYDAKGVFDYLYRGVQKLIGVNPELERLEKERDTKIAEIEDQFNSSVSNIYQPQTVKTNALIDTDKLGISQLSKNVTTNPLTGKPEFDVKNAVNDINKATSEIKNYIGQFDNLNQTVIPDDATEEEKQLLTKGESLQYLKSGRSVPKEGFNLNSEFYNKLGQYGIDLQYSGDNKSRDLATSNLNYGQISIIQGLGAEPKASNVETDGYVFNGLKAQIQTIDSYIKASQKQIDGFSAEAGKAQGTQRKENIDFINSLNQNVTSLKNLKQKLTEWGDKNLSGYKKYLSSQEEIQRLDNEAPISSVISGIIESTAKIPSEIFEFGKRVTYAGYNPFASDDLTSTLEKQIFPTEYLSERKLTPAEVALKRLATPTLEDIEPTVLEKGLDIPFSKASAIYKSGEGSYLNPFNYTYSLRPMFYQSATMFRDMYLLGGTGAALEGLGSKAIGTSFKMLTEGATKQALGWTIEKQIAKNLALAGVAEKAGESVLKYQAGNIALGAAKFGNRAVAMVIPTAALYGNEINKEFMDAGFTPDQAMKLTALSVLFEGGSEAIFGNEIKLYNALTDRTTDTGLKNLAMSSLERAFQDRAKKALGKELSQKELGTLTKFWTNLQRFKNTRGVSSILEGLETGGEESLEEISSNLGNALFTTPLGRSYNPSYKGEEFTLENQVLTFMNTIATMVPTMGVTGYRSFKDFNKKEKLEGLQAKFEVGSTPEVHIGILSDAFNKGELSKEEYEKRVVLVNKYGDYLKKSSLETLPVIFEKGYKGSEADALRFTLFSSYLEKDKLEQNFAQALTEEDKAGFSQLIAEKEEQIIKYLTNGLYENEEQRKKINSDSLDYLFNQGTMKGFNDEEKLTTVMDQLVTQSLVEKDQELVKKYDEKVNLLDTRKKELIAKKEEEAKSPEEKAAKNNASGSITIPGIGIGELQLDYNTPYYYSSNRLTTTEEGQEVRTNQLMTILKDNGDGTLQVSIEGEEQTIPISEIANSRILKEETVKQWKDKNSPLGFVFEHENDAFTFEFDKPTRNRDKVVQGRISYNPYEKSVELVYKNKKGERATYILTKEDINNLNKGRLKYVQTYETAEQFKNRKSRMEELAKKLSFEETSDEPFRRWQFITEFIERKTQELAKTKELIKTVQDRLTKANKTLSEFVDDINNKKSVDVQEVINSANELKQKVKELEYNLQILEDQKDDIEEQIEYTKRYDKPEFDTTKTLVDELIEDQFDLEVQLEKVNGVIDSLKEMIDSVTNFIYEMLDIVNDVYEKAKTLYPKIPLDNTKWTEFVGKNPNISKLKPEFAKDLTLFNNVINDNLDKIEVEDKKVENLTKSLQANISLARTIQDQIRFQEELIREAVKNQKKFEEEKVTEKVKKRASEIFGTANDNQTSNQTGDLEDDEKLSKEESQKIPLEIFFNTSTSGTTFEGLNLNDPAVLRLQNFSNNVQDPENYSMLVVTADNAKQYGLEDIIFSDEQTTNTGDNENDYDIKLVIVDKKTKKFVNQDGKETTDPKQYVYSSLRKASTVWSNGEKAYPTRKGKEEEDEKFAKLYEKQHRELRKELIEQIKNGISQKLDIQYVSRGRKVNEGKSNPVLGTAIPANTDLTNQKVIVVAKGKDPENKTGRLTYGNGNVSINMPVGRPVLSLGNTFEFLYNKKFTKQDIDKYVRLFKLLYDSYKNKDVNTRNTILEYLKKTLYFRNPAETGVKQAQETKIGRSQIWLSDVLGVPYLNLGSEGGRIPFNFEEGNVNAFFSLYAFFTGKEGKGVYHNVDIKDDGEGLIGKAFIEITDVKDGKLVTREWPSYQDYLLSNKYPKTGAIRPTEEIPLTIKMQPSTPNTPNRAGRYIVYQNKENDDVTRANPRVTVVEKTAKGKQTKKANVTTATKDAQVKYKEQFSEEIQNIKKLKPGKVYRWKSEKDGVMRYIDFTFTDKMYVKVIDSNYNKGGELMDTATIAKSLNAYLKEGKPKPTTVIIYELIPTDENKSKAAEKKPTKKAPAKKKAKKQEEIEEESAGDEFEEIEDGVSEDFDPLKWGVDKDDKKEKGKSSAPKDPTTKFKDKEGETEMLDAFDKLFEAAKKKETDEDDEDVAKKGGEFRKAIKEEYQLENLQEAKIWWEERFPQVPFNIAFGLINNKAWGMIKNATLTLSNLAEVGTVYHEAFEVVNKYMLTPRGRRAIRKEFRRRQGSFVDYETGKTVEYSKATDYQIKEQISEEYREYGLSGKTKIWKGEYRKTSLFEKISDFVDFIVNTILGSPDNIEKIFGKISEGAYKDRVLPPANNEIDPEYRVARGAKSLKRTNPILFRRIMDSMTNLLFERLRKQDEPIIDVLSNDFKIADELNAVKKKLNSFYNLTIISSTGEDAKIRDIVNVATKDQFVELFKDMKVAALFYRDNNNTALIENLVNILKEKDYINKSFNLDTNAENLSQKAAIFYYAMQKGGSSILYDAIANYNYISENWSDITKEHKDFLAKYSIEFESDQDEMEDAAIVDENADSVSYAAEVTEVSRKKNASFEIKLLIATLREMVFDVTKASKYAADEVKTARPKVNELLLANVVDYGKVFTDLLYKLAPATNMDEMFDILREEAEINPVIATLNAKLKIDETNLKDSDIDLQSKFYVSMNSLLVKYSKLLLFPDSKMSTLLDLNEMDDFNTIREKWVSATVSNNSKIIKLNTKTKEYEIVQDFPYTQINNITTAFDFLNYLGYGFDFDTSILNTSEKETVINSAINLLKTLRNTKNPEVLLQDSGTIRNNLNNLASVYMKYASTYAEPQHLNIERQPVQNIILHNFIGTIAKAMNASKTLDGFISKIPQLNPKAIGNGFLSFSQILNPKSKFYRDGVLSKKLDIQVMEGSEVLESGKGTPTSKLTLKDRIAQEFAYNLSGLYYILTPADTKTQWGINFGEFITQEQARDIPKVTGIFKKYLKAEILAAQQENIANLDRLNQYYDKEKTQKVGASLRFFRDILGFELDLTKTADEAIAEKENQINEAILKYIETETNETYNFFNDEELIIPYKEGEEEDGFVSLNAEDKFTIMFAPTEFMGEGKSKEELRDLIRYSQINYIFNIFEQHKLFWGDPAQWKDISKRVKSFTSGRNLSVTNYAKFNDHFNKKLNTLNYIDENGNEKTVILQPGDFGHVYYNDEMRTTTYRDVTVESELYDNVNEPDGQGIVFPNGYREIRQRATTWDQAEQEQHEWDTALCRWEVTNGIKWEDRNKENPKSIGIKENLYPEGQRGEDLKAYDEYLLSKGNPYLVRKKLSLEQPNIKTAITNVLKPIYSGFKKAFVDGAGNRTEINSAVVNLDKFSLAPMTWRLVRGKHAQKFFVEHFKKGTTYIKFESVQKVGLREDIEDLYTQNGDINLQLDSKGNATNIKHDVLDFKYFGIQVETKSQKDTSTLGSQLTKLITLNVNKIKNKILVDNNSRFLRALKEMSKRDIFNKFGIEETTVKGEKVYKFKNFETVAELIQEEFKKRETPENLKDAMQLDEDGNFYLKFDMVIGSERVESIITSIIDKNILRPKMFGGQMPQIASTLFENSKRFVKKIVNGKPVMTSNELKFYEDKDGKRYCEVYLPFYMQEYIEKGVELSISDIPDDLKYGIGFRIPTQNTNSIENFKIKGFLPVEYGNSIVVPSEITAKAGSDFDIDKLNIYLYNYFINKDGKPEKIKFDERPSFDEDGSISDAAKERYDINEKRRDPEAAKIRKEYRKRIEDVKKEIQKQREKDDDEIKKMKSQKKLSETQIDELYVSKKLLEKRIENLKQDIQDVKTLRKDFEKGFDEDYESAKIKATDYGYPGNRIAFFERIDNDIIFLSNQIDDYKSEIDELSERLKEISLTKYRKEAIDKKYEERNKNTDYLHNLKQDLIKKEAAEINAIVPKMSLEEFAILPIEMQNSRKAIENAYIDNIRAILELPEMFEFLVKPNSAEELKQEAKDINELYGINKERSSTYYISRVNNAKDRHAFLVGKDAVGIGASHQTQHAISQIVDLEFSTKSKGMEKFNLFFDSNYRVEGDTVIYSLSEMYDKYGKLISDSISMFIDAAVDIAKDPYIFDINANYNTYSIYLTALRLGVPLPIVTRWFNQPIVREYVKLMQQNKSISTELLRKKLRKGEMILKAKQIVFNEPNLLSADSTYPEKEGNFTKEELEDLIKEYVEANKNQTDVSLEFKESQSLILDQFIMMQDLSWDLFRFGQAINLDTSRTVSFESIIIKIFKIKAALDGPFSDYVVKVFQDTFIGSIYQTKNEFLEAIKPLYLTQSDKARKYINPILEDIYSAMGSQDDIEEAARDLKKHFVNYLLHTTSITFEGAKNPILLTSKIKELLIEDSPKLASNKLRKAQANQKLGKLPQNFFTDNLLGTLIKFAKLSGKDVNNIQLMRRMLDKTDIDLTVADFRNLNDNIETYDLAQTLLKTALLQSGIITDPKSFSQVIPNEMFQDVARQVQNIFENIGSDNLDKQLENFKNSYYQNQWYDRGLIPKATKRTSPSVENPQGNERLVPGWLTVKQEEKEETKKGEKEKVVKKRSGIKLYQYFADSTSNNGKYKPSKDVRSPFLIDVSVDKISPRKIAAMKKAGDFSFIKYTLYKRVEVKRPDGKIDVPLAQKMVGKDKNGVEQYVYYVLYYPVERYGQRFTSVEHYSNDNAKSQVNTDPIPQLTNEKVYKNLKNNGRMSDLFLYQDILPNLAEKEEDTINEVKSFMGLAEEKEIIENTLFGEEIIPIENPDYDPNNEPTCPF